MKTAKVSFLRELKLGGSSIDGGREIGKSKQLRRELAGILAGDKIYRGGGKSEDVLHHCIGQAGILHQEREM